VLVFTKDTMCVFNTHDEIIKYLFFQCNFACSIWSVIQAASGLYPPTSIANIFENWLSGINYKYRILLRVGVMALILSLWLCRNHKKKIFLAGNLQMYGHSPSMVTTSSHGGPRSLLGGVYASGRYS
jgi:hypothetical protein